MRLLPIRHLGAIGHLMLELDCYVKEGVLGLRRGYHAVVLAPRHQVVNLPALDYWRPHVTIVTSPLLCSLLHPLLRDERLRHDIERYAMNDQGTIDAFTINARWGDRPPLLGLTAFDRNRGWERLRELGVPEGAWFVCVHCREQSPAAHNPEFEHRDADIASYVPALEAIAARGGWCVRMGSHPVKPLPPLANVVDYANSGARTDWMDVFLSAECRFMLGSNSGLNNLPAAFGRPCALANMVPMGVLPLRPGDLGIPKLMRSTESGRILNLDEVLGSEIGSFHATRLYREAGIEVVDNTPEEIRALAEEMLDRLEGRAAYDDRDRRLQESFHELVRPGHYSYGSAARIGRDFLRAHSDLLLVAVA